jgi:isopenicillin N synthase-like dioxygenase
MVETIKDGDVELYADFDNRFLNPSGIARSAVTALPLIDVSPFVAGGSLSARAAVARQIRRACIDIGFFYLVGHGIPQSDLDAVIALGHRFFALSRAEKVKHRTGEGAMLRGYMPPGGEHPEANPDKAADLRERFAMIRDGLPGEPAGGRVGSTPWPGADVMPGFETMMKGYTRRMLTLADHVAHALALSLDLPETHFADTHAYPGASLFFNYYPSIDRATADRTQWSFSPHTDYGTFTLLLQDQLGGLQVRNAAGEWIDATPVAGSFVVNIGDLFAMWTNDLYVSNLHRAINVSGAARISLPFFVSPQSTAVIRCLETCQGPGNPPRHPPVEAGSYMTALVAQSHRSGRPGLSVRTATRLHAAARP